MNDMAYVPIQPPDPIGDLLQYVGLHPRDVPAAAQAGAYMKMEEFKTEQDKQYEGIEDLVGMPRGMMSGDRRILEDFRKRNAPSKGYFIPDKGEPLKQDQDLLLDPTRGGTQMRWLKGT